MELVGSSRCRDQRRHVGLRESRFRIGLMSPIPPPRQQLRCELDGPATHTYCFRALKFTTLFFVLPVECRNCFRGHILLVMGTETAGVCLPSFRAGSCTQARQLASALHRECRVPCAVCPPVIYVEIQHYTTRIVLPGAIQRIPIIV